RSGEAPSVLRERWPRRLLRSARRRPALTTATALLLVFGLLISTYVSWSGDLNAAERRAEQKYRAGLTSFEGELAKGRPITVIGPATRELPYRWRAGDGIVNVTPEGSDNGPVFISARVPSLLEVFPAPSKERYELKVQMREERTFDPFPEVGI